LEDHVITDEVYRLAEELIWEALWDDARKVNKQRAAELDDLFGQKEPDPTAMRILRENYTRPVQAVPDGRTLLYANYGELLCNLHK
jgi:ribosome maturation protein Sdo1